MSSPGNVSSIGGTSRSKSGLNDAKEILPSLPHNVKICSIESGREGAGGIFFRTESSEGNICKGRAGSLISGLRSLLLIAGTVGVLFMYIERI